MQKFVFDPAYVTLRCKEESLNLNLQIQTDLTWTGRTAVALLAAKLGCNPDGLSLFHGNVHVADQTFLAEYETVDFTMKFKACTPRHVAWKPGTSEVKDPGFVPSSNDVRWFGRHPNRKVTRTCSADRNMTVGMLW